MSTGLILSRTLPVQIATRLRGTATVLLDIIKTDGGVAAAGIFLLDVNGALFPIMQGSNSVTWEIDITPDADGLVEVSINIVCADPENVDSAWASLDVTQCDALVDESGSVATTPLTMTPVGVNGFDRGGSGGFGIAKTGALASVTAIEITGYYTNTVEEPPLTATSLCAPRWMPSAANVAVSPAVTIPMLDAGNWGWNGGDPLASTFPIDQISVVMVSLDGGASVVAILPNGEGY